MNTADLAREVAASRERERRARRLARDAVQVEEARRQMAEARRRVPIVAVPRIRRRVAPAPAPPALGWRQPRKEPLNSDSVLLSDVKPPTMTTLRSHQTCGICLHLKSHPVSYVPNPVVSFNKD